MTEKLAFSDIREWALTNGFAVENGDGRLVAPYGDAKVVIEFLERTFRVAMEHGDHRRVLASPMPSQTQIDDNGMLQGAGLFTYFYTLYFDMGEDGILPVWFNGKVAEMVADHAPQASARRAGAVGGPTL